MPSAAPPGHADLRAARSRKPHGARRTRRDAWRTTDRPLLRVRSSGLEAIVKALETEDTDLERASRSTQRGQRRSSRAARTLLKSAQAKIDAVNAPARDARPRTRRMSAALSARRLDAGGRGVDRRDPLAGARADPRRQSSRRRRARDEARRDRPRRRARRRRGAAALRQPRRREAGRRARGVRHRPTGADALDVGASTGGFTDALLQHGARHVTALDVGYGQLAWKLRGDPRVTVVERTNFRTLPDDAFPGRVRPDRRSTRRSSRCARSSRARCGYLRAGGAIVALVKPQFEAGRERIGGGGVVRDPGGARGVLREVRDALRDARRARRRRGALAAARSGGQRRVLLSAAPRRHAVDDARTRRARRGARARRR